MSVWYQYWDVYTYFGIWLALSVLLERLQRRHYLKGKRTEQQKRVTR